MFRSFYGIGVPRVTSGGIQAKYGLTRVAQDWHIRKQMKPKLRQWAERKGKLDVFSSLLVKMDNLKGDRSGPPLIEQELWDILEILERW